jgi:hypothetical protein
MEKGYLLKLFQKWWEEEIKESDGGSELSMIYLICCKNICKCHSVLSCSTKIKNNLNKIVAL